MFTEKGLAIIGVLLLVIGLFLPVWSYNDTGDTSNLIDTNTDNDITAEGPGVYVLIVVAVALLLIVMDRGEYTWVTSLLIFFPLFIIFAGVWIAVQNDTGTRLEFGWSVLAGGLILMSAPLWPSSLRIWLDGQDIEGSDTEEDDDAGESEDSELPQEVES
jgi:uncharacterized membrane protein